MMGERVSVIGRTVRKIEPLVLQRLPATARGSRSTRATRRGAWPTVSRVTRPSRSAWNAIASHSTPIAPSTCATGAVAVAVGSGASAAKSISSETNCTPPIPSVREWWIFMTPAARPSSSPSTVVQVHSGRARSKPPIPSVRARSRAPASAAGGAAATRRTCHERSKSGSTVQSGVATRHGGSTRRCRRPGTIRLARSRRASTRAGSGGWSNTITTTTVERSSGSRSMYHVKASLWLMWRSPGAFMTLLSVRSLTCSRRARPRRARRTSRR